MMKFIKKEKMTIIIYLFLFSLTCFVNINSKIDPDYYWHIKAGKYMLDNGVILTKDIFSWVPNIVNTYWMSHEWLFEYLIAFLSNIFPQNYVFIFTFSLSLILLFLVFFINKKKWLKNVLFTLIWFFISMSLLMPFIMPRPQLFDFIFLALCLYLLYDLRDNEFSNKIYFIPLVSLAWFNLHGGSSNIPYILTLLFIIAGLFNFKVYHMEAKRLSDRQIKKYFIVFILCILSLFLNPHGIKMIAYPYENMANSYMLETITEWGPTNLNKVYHLVFFIYFALNLLVILTSKKKINFIDMTIFAFTLFLGLKSTRFWMFFVISSFVIICNYIPEYKMKENDINYILIIVVLLIASSISYYGNTISNYNEKMVPENIVKYLKENRPKRLYNEYDFGGYLVYKGIPVFIDGRADLYSKYNYRDAVNLSYLNCNFQKIINKYNFDYYLVYKSSGLDTYLNLMDDYELVISSKKINLYKTKE